MEAGRPLGQRPIAALLLRFLGSEAGKGWVRGRAQGRAQGRGGRPKVLRRPGILHASKAHVCRAVLLFLISGPFDLQPKLMVSKGEEDNMAIIKEFMRFKVHMEGSVNGHEFEIEGEGEGRPYEGTQTAKLKVTKGGPLPFAWDILSPQFMYGSKAYVKHPADIPDYLKLSFPEGFKWERVMNFEDGGVVTVTQDSSLQDGEFIYKVKLRGTNFPSDGPVMQKKTMGWEASSERMYPEDGALKGEIKQRLKLKDGGHYDAEVKTTYKAKKPVQLPGAYNVNIKLDITSHNEDYTIVEQYERAEGRHSTGGMDELYK